MLKKYEYAKTNPFNVYKMSSDAIGTFQKFEKNEQF